LDNHLVEIFRNFIDNENIVSIKEYGDGHINDTYLVTTDSSQYILQRVNQEVFNITNLTNNYKQLFISYKTLDESIKHFPDLCKNKDGELHILDSMGSAWRVAEFLDNINAFSISPDIVTSTLAGKAMGRFQNFLNRLDTDSFIDTIPDFHNPHKRFSSFEKSLDNSESALISAAKPEVDFALNNRYITDNMSNIISNNILPVRITHNDPKLENILFKSDKSDAYIIDLDTIMKGTLIFDFGDMVRSITSLAKEDEKDLAKVKFNFDHFRALAGGYFSELTNTISKSEKENIYNGILSVIYVQGIRFLGDFLEGNNYYKVQYPEHNLVRCRTQFKLLKEIIEMETEIKSFLRSN